jgi:hypothetical protein
MESIDQLLGSTRLPLGNSENYSDVSNLRMFEKSIPTDLYWELIDESLANSKNQYGQEIYLTKVIAKLPPAEILGFQLKSIALINQLYRSDIACASAIMNGNKLGETFEHFRYWVISQGRILFEAVLAQPDCLSGELNQNDSFYDFEGFKHIAEIAFKRSTNKNMFDYLPLSEQSDAINNATLTMNWDDNEPATMQAICPDLFARFWR